MGVLVDRGDDALDRRLAAEGAGALVDVRLELLGADPLEPVYPHRDAGRSLSPASGCAAGGRWFDPGKWLIRFEI